MTDWQPIDTAPRDGTRVLTWHSMGSGGAVVNNPSHHAYGQNGWCVIQSTLDELWPSEILETGSVTHWMPLPPPPKDTTTE